MIEELTGEMLFTSILGCNAVLGLVLGILFIIAAVFTEGWSLWREQ